MMITRKYIDRAALFNDLSNAKTLADAFATIQAAPAADVVEVRHGRWEKVNDDDSLYRCSVCGETSCCNAAYCNECGARMDEETE